MADDRSPAAMWDAGGAAYDNIAFMVSDALAHAAQRLNAQAGERILDIATGTGWTARLVARSGAQVTAVDFAEDLLAAARTLSAHVRPPITFEFANAQDLPFDDGAFDAVISTFGVMFATDQRKAAAEMARVCKPGGRLCLTTWEPDGYVKKFFAMTGKYTDAPPPDPSPLAWGDPDHVRGLLGDAFALKFERGVNRSYHPDTEQIAALYEGSFGPVRQLMQTLDGKGRAALHRDLVAFHDHGRSDMGLTAEREYVVIHGTRR